MSFLYSLFDNPFARKALSQVDIPNFVEDNLKYSVRPYQEEAFRRFIYQDTEDFEGKPNKPLHLLYNMATGSGKTMVMAGLMLYLYEKGYRNFLFFVNSNNIIEKTKDNFLNNSASKYLFKEKIVIEGKQIYLKEVSNFETSDNDNINIKFTTIQQLHIDLNDTKENSITYEDLQDKKIVLIADEAHHLSSGTKGGELFGSWEGTVMNILKQNYENILLEFTATLDYESREIVSKYQNKVLYKYDLAQFRADGYSKEINLVRSDYDERERILQALILNEYRQILATSNNINLKPVILFKAKRTIKESEENKIRFHGIIETLGSEDLEKLRKTSQVEIVSKAFNLFKKLGYSLDQIVEKIQSDFKEENCISANNDKEAASNQILLNTLEDENNPIRAVFAVQKLNEGWDVLNLFDIVRLYDTRDGKDGKPGKTTISEAQLIGRGARYFPFEVEEGQDKYTRKYDNDDSDLKILEELYYHTKDDSRYISELKTALIDTGVYEDPDNYEMKDLFLKPEFKKTEFYKSGRVIFNKKIERSYDNIRSFEDLGVKRRNYKHVLSSGYGQISLALEKDGENSSTSSTKTQVDISVGSIPINVIRYTLSQNTFFYFSSLNQYFPSIKSISEFIESGDYLGGLEITFEGTENRVDVITYEDYLDALTGLLSEVEQEIKGNLTEYQGSNYISDYIHKVFRDKSIKVQKGSERADGQETLVLKESWYAYNANYGTSEEKRFIELFSRKFEAINQKYQNIFLIRNEREIKIYDDQGRAFEPDFVLFCKQKDGDNVTYQVFIEPKGNHLVGKDAWKNEFLKKIQSEKQTIKIEMDQYLITAVPFYNYDSENEFADQLQGVLN